MKLFLYSMITTVTLTTSALAHIAHAHASAPVSEENKETCPIHNEWTGKNIDDINLSKLDQKSYRILQPNSVMTMDYSPNRLNITITDDGVILAQECG